MKNKRSKAEGKQTKKIPCLHSLLFTLVILCVIFIALEVLVRITGVSEKSEIDDPAKVVLYERFKLDLLWMENPFNAHPMGRIYRDTPFCNRVDTVPPADPETIRIICIGGSVTRGFPHNVEFSYPNTLETILNNRFKQQKFEVLNAGGFGSTSYIGLFFFRELYNQYKPDILTVLYTVNDANTSASIGGILSDRQYVELHRRFVSLPGFRFTRSLLKRLHVYQLLNHGIFASARYISELGDKTRHKKLFSKRVPPDDFKENLSGFLNTAEENGFETVLMYEGEKDSNYDENNRFVRKQYWQRIHELAEERKTVLLIPDRVFSKQKIPREDFYVDFCHMTKEGLQLYAKQMADDLVETGVIDRAMKRAAKRSRHIPSLEP